MLTTTASNTVIFIVIVLNCLFTVVSGLQYDVVFDGVTWLKGAATFFRANKLLYTTTDGSLVQQGDVIQSKGTDSLGDFTAQTVKYLAADRKLETTVRSYRHNELQADILTQKFVDGLTSTSAPSPNDVISGFPSFSVTSPEQKKLGYLAYNGNFAGWSHMATGRWKYKMGKLKDGLQSGPLLLFDTVGRVVVISAFNQFMAASYQHNTTSSIISWGIMGGVNTIPAEYSYSTLIYYSKQGINKAMSGWGSTLRHWYKRRSNRQIDISINYIGYYTDNGAYYYQVPEKGMNFEQTLLAVYNHSRNYTIPYRYIQYDDWFYPTAGPTGYGATVEWDAMPSVFPHGLQYLYNVTNLPVVAHNRYWSDKTPYAKQNGGPFNFLFDGHGNAIPDDQSFWDWLMSKAKQWGLVTYEQDWLDYQIESISVVHNDLTLGGRWLRQMGEAARRYGLTIQYCMAFPRHVLAALEIEAVTQVRASIDYQLRPNQYRIGVSSIILSALGLTPFKDNFWTRRVEPGNRYHKTEENVLLQAIVAVLSTGPVGVGDKIGLTDVDLVKRLTTADGLLLQPSHPATAIDAQLVQAAFGGKNGPKGEVWTTMSVISGWIFGVIFAVDLNESYTLHTNQTGWGPQLPPSVVYSSKYFMSPWQPPALYNNISPLHLTTCNNYTSHCLYYTSPVFTVSGVQLYLAGELEKVVAVSSKRVVSISVSTVDVVVELRGSATELVLFDVCRLTASQATCSTIQCHLTDTGSSTLSALAGTCY